MMEKNAKIYVAGHRGMVGSAIVRELQRQGYTNIVTRTHKELDLTRQDAVEKFFATEKPEYVFLAAAKVGGIVANQNALADFMYDNMILEMNVIHSAWKNGCRKLEFLGSSCIYPRMAPQPMKESCLLTSELEKTNEAYALAKISGLKYCEFLNRQYGTDYISVMPTNLYGPNDNYHPTHSHVLPALIRRFHEAKESGAANLVLMGIEPTYPSEKYGYIIPESTDHVAEVRTFREKPTADVAEQYIAQGALWNGGVFAYKMGYVMDKAHEMMDFTDYQDLFDKYDTMKKISFDYAVAEHEPKIQVVRFAGMWKDLGTWNTLTEAMDESIIGKSDVLKFLLEDNCSLVVRPSGTEPKLKIYISVSAENKEMAEEVEDEIAKTAEKWIC